MDVPEVRILGFQSQVSLGRVSDPYRTQIPNFAQKSRPIDQLTPGSIFLGVQIPEPPSNRAHGCIEISFRRGLPKTGRVFWRRAKA